MGFWDNLGIDVDQYEPNTKAILKALEAINATLQGLSVSNGSHGTSLVAASKVQTQSFTDHYFLVLPDPITSVPSTYNLEKPADAVIFTANVDVQVEFDKTVTDTTPVIGAYQTINFDLFVQKSIQYRLPTGFKTAVKAKNPSTPLDTIQGTAYAMLFYY